MSAKEYIIFFLNNGYIHIKHKIHIDIIFIVYYLLYSDTF